MATLSPARLSVPVLEGLGLTNRGKVRDTYSLPPYPGRQVQDKFGNLLLPVATDGISIFDIVLNALVPQKGYVLTAMTHFWLTYLESTGIKTHFVAAGVGIDEYLPWNLRGNIDLQRRAMVVMELKMILAEFIKRLCLTGSVLQEYETRGTVYGKKMPTGLRDGDVLTEALFTPTTKASEGHDKPLDTDEVRRQYRSETAVFLAACERCIPLAKERGIVVADTKGELGYDKKGVIRIGDEWLTPDSSRFWDALEHATSRANPDRKAPPPFDKQLVRAFGIEHGINKLDPMNPEHVARAHALIIPQDVIDATTHTYRYVFWRLTGMTLDEYTRRHLGVHVPHQKKKVVFVFGSRSDVPQMKGPIENIATTNLSLDIEVAAVHVISCHRNTEELMKFVDRDCDNADVVVAIAGKAAALPGMLDALIHQGGLKLPVIGVGVGDVGTKPGDAAKLSIEELPNAPVVMDETRGEAYMGPEGLRAAIQRIAQGELPPQKKRPHKPAELFIELSQF